MAGFERCSLRCHGQRRGARPAESAGRSRMAPRARAPAVPATGQGRRRVDDGDVAVRLGKVADLPPVADVVLLGQQPDVAPAMAGGLRVSAVIAFSTVIAVLAPS